MKLFCWGANNYGQLGIGHMSEQETLPRIVNLDNISELCVENIKSIIGGGGHTVLLTKGGEVFVCGWNKAGQLGLGHTNNVDKFAKVDLGDNFIEEVAAGWDFTILLDKTGTLLCCGSNSFGQLGNYSIVRSFLLIL